MKILFLDTSSTVITVALLEDLNLIKTIQEKNDHQLSARIFPLIDEIFTSVNWNINDIERIFVVNGPGSFTGIRIGVTIAKVLAWANNIPISTISELELLATTKHNQKYIASCIDARRDAVFAGIYDSSGNVLNDQYITISELNNIIDEKKDIVAVSYDDLTLKCDVVKPQIDIKTIVEKHINDKCLNPHEVNPIYLKLTEAEEKHKNDSKVSN